MNIFFSDFPGQAQIDTEVFMYEDVPHTGYFFPGDVRIFIFYLLRNVFDGLAYDFDSSNDGILQLHGSEKLLFCYAFEVLLEMFYALQYMLDEDFGVFIHKMTFCSLRILSLRSGCKEL